MLIVLYDETMIQQYYTMSSTLPLSINGVC